MASQSFFRNVSDKSVIAATNGVAWLGPRSHPLPVLLHLEWLLLALTALDELLPAPYSKLVRLPFVNLPCLLAFGSLGLGLPDRRNSLKGLHLAIEIGLLLVGNYVGGSRMFPLLSLVLVKRACISFNLRGRIAVSLCAIALFVLGMQQRIQHLNFSSSPPPFLQEALPLIQLSLTVLFVLSISFILLMVNALFAERHSRAALTIANDRLRRYAMRIEDQATLQERNRIAREIHDSLGHSLTAMNIQLETAIKLWSIHPDRATSYLLEAKHLGSTALQDVRRSVGMLRSDPLQGRPLAAAIADLAKNLERSIPATCTLQFPETLVLPPEVQMTLYRITQESLTNICKYAQGNGDRPIMAAICVTAGPDCVILEISDNGCGFEPSENVMGFGIQGMRERTLALSGQFVLESSPGGGCKVKVALPGIFGFEEA